MAHASTFLCIGNSNMDGIARLSAVPASEFERWTDRQPPGSSFPYEVTMPDVRVFTPRLPYSAGDVRTIVGAGASTITFTGEPLPASRIDGWLCVRTNDSGQGQHRRIVGGVGTNTATVAPAWSPAIANDGTVEFLGESHTLGGIQTNRTVTKTGNTPAFTASLVGRWIVAISGNFVSEARKISAVTDTALTVDNGWSSVPQEGDGICIMTGTRAADSLASYRASGSVRNLTFAYDDAATYSTGFEYPNFKAVPASGPLVHRRNQLINCIPELAWHLRGLLGRRIHMLPLGVSACTLAPLPIGTLLQAHAYGWTHDITHLDFHPTSPAGLYVALLDAIRSMAAALQREGSKIDVRGVFCTLVENDAGSKPSAVKVGANMVLLRDSLRSWLEAQQFTTLKAPRVPWIMSGIRPAVFPFGKVVMEQLAEIAATDPFSGLFGTEGFGFEADRVHLDALGMIQLGKAFFAKWVDIANRDQTLVET